MTLSQRRLVLELKVSIDRAMRTRKEQDEAFAVRLASTHVKELKKRYVQHNVGMRRLEWLASRLEVTHENAEGR